MEFQQTHVFDLADNKSLKNDDSIISKVHQGSYYVQSHENKLQRPQSYLEDC